MFIKKKNFFDLENYLKNKKNENGNHELIIKVKYINLIFSTKMA